MSQAITNFQFRVYELLNRIPKGKVVTYAILAKALNCKSCQAVGGALKRNPFAPEVPCHRVVKSDLTIGGFCGETDGPQIAKKRALLVSEGVQFDSQGKVKSDYLYYFDLRVNTRSSSLESLDL